ncbi:MAG: hypothetical protein JXA67_22780 [Micromonosporaceae bacterium]|nr:hypothetical protein [Micromonosporaceae bacterium]
MNTGETATRFWARPRFSATPTANERESEADTTVEPDADANANGAAPARLAAGSRRPSAGQTSDPTPATAATPGTEQPAGTGRDWPAAAHSTLDVGQPALDAAHSTPDVGQPLAGNDMPYRPAGSGRPDPNLTNLPEHNQSGRPDQLSQHDPAHRVGPVAPAPVPGPTPRPAPRPTPGPAPRPTPAAGPVQVPKRAPQRSVPGSRQALARTDAAPPRVQPQAGPRAQADPGSLAAASTRALARRGWADPAVIPGEQATEPPTQHITVNIGRVQVQSPPLAPALVPVPAAGPGSRQLSLDEYLERRGGGSR